MPRLWGGAISTVYKCGVARAQILYYLKNLFCETKLTDADRKEISEYLNDLSQNRPVDNDYSTERKNVVFILCETYLSVTSDLTMPDGKSVTPFLDSLRHAQDTFYNGNVVSNVELLLKSNSVIDVNPSDVIYLGFELFPILYIFISDNLTSSSPICII